MAWSKHASRTLFCREVFIDEGCCTSIWWFYQDTPSQKPRDGFSLAIRLYFFTVQSDSGDYEQRTVSILLRPGVCSVCCALARRRARHERGDKRSPGKSIRVCRGRRHFLRHKLLSPVSRRSPDFTARG